MSGYALTAPLAGFGPPGWVAWAVLGTAITIGTVIAGKKVYDATRTDPVPTTRAPAIPNTDAKPCKDCPRPYSIRVHAQGIDCGGTTGSTIGAVPLVNPTVPFPAAAGVALAATTFALLARRQRDVRTLALANMERWLLNRPPSGFLGQKTFPAADPSGGKRFDTDSYGPTPNYVT